MQHFESLHSEGRGRQISEFEASLVYRVSSRHPGLYRETLSQNKNKNRKRKEKLSLLLDSKALSLQDPIVAACGHDTETLLI
jgi:gamma-glutamyl-gamma-aminobutyrate hydrolase PuuD